MSVEIQNNSGKNLDWNAEFNIVGPGDMCFSCAGKTILESDGIELGMLKESNGIEKICRSHFSNKTGWSWVETKTHHPFGPEPVVKRKWEQAANHIKVVSDIIIRATTPMDHISIDSLKLPGEWNKVLIFSQLTPDSTEISIEEFDLTNFSGRQKKFDHIPLVLLFVAEDGTELEIGAGYDLWRWHEIISRFEGKTEFALKGTDEGLVFDRKIFFSNEEYEMPRNNFRFSWYFAWGNVNDNKPSDSFNSYTLLAPSDKKLILKEEFNVLPGAESENKPVDTTANHAYCLDNSTWPSTAVVENDKNIYPCFCSRQTGNYLKSWLRSISNKIRDQKKDVYLCGIDVHVCSNASHMIRGKRKTLVHWDYIYLLGYWDWANKHLSETDTAFHILFRQDSLFANLPSVKGLSGGF